MGGPERSSNLPEVLQDAGVRTQAFWLQSPGSEPLALFPFEDFLGLHFLICTMNLGMSHILSKFYSRTDVMEDSDSFPGFL